MQKSGTITKHIDTEAGRIILKRSYGLTPGVVGETARICIPASSWAFIDPHKIGAYLVGELWEDAQINRTRNTLLQFPMSDEGEYRFIIIQALTAANNKPGAASVRDKQLEIFVDAIATDVLMIITDDITRMLRTEEKVSGGVEG